MISISAFSRNKRKNVKSAKEKLTIKKVNMINLVAILQVQGVEKRMKREGEDQDLGLYLLI